MIQNKLLRLDCTVRNLEYHRCYFKIASFLDINSPEWPTDRYFYLYTGMDTALLDTVAHPGYHHRACYYEWIRILVSG